MAEEAGRALWERLEAHHKAGYLSLHMPGHKENAALAPYLARLGAPPGGPGSGGPPLPQGCLPRH